MAGVKQCGRCSEVILSERRERSFYSPRVREKKEILEGTFHIFTTSLLITSQRSLVSLEKSIHFMQSRVKVKEKSVFSISFLEKSGGKEIKQN